jgi:FKBP-type peptidyl-prolyl cis-trans isomerase FkpA
MRNLFILLAGVLLLGSCNMTYEKTKSGIRYKIFKGKGGKQIKIGDFVQYNQTVLIPERDTVLYSTYGKMHGYDKVVAEEATRPYMEILPKCSVGDSIVLLVSVDSMAKKNLIQYNNVFRRGSMLTFRMRITKSYSTEAEITADVMQETKAENERKEKELAAKSQSEIKELESYLSKNNIQYTKTPSGAYVEIKEKGTGPIGDTGATAMVFYTGKLFKDGKVFDSNTDPKFQHTEAYPVNLGMGGSVRGFDEGLMYFGKGGKGRIFIPSFLGYGDQGAGDRIPPNASLIFEVEIRDIKPKQAASATVPSGKPTH